MYISNINDAKTNLSQLIKRALAGDEVVIARANEPLVRLEPFVRDTSPRVGGQWAGRVTLSADFEFTDEELEDLFETPLACETK